MSSRRRRAVREVDIAAMLCFCSASDCRCELVRDVRMTTEGEARMLVQHASQGGVRAQG